MCHIPREAPLTLKALLAFASDLASEAIGQEIRLTGKCFRRGGNSGLLSAGVEISDIMAAGRWQTARMVDVYASATARDDRCAAISRAMAPSSAPAGPGADALYDPSVAAAAAK